MATKFNSDSLIKKTEVVYNDPIDSLTQWVPTTATTVGVLVEDYVASEEDTPGSIKVSLEGPGDDSVTLNGLTLGSSFDATDSVIHIRYKVVIKGGDESADDIGVGKLFITNNNYTDHNVYSLFFSDTFHTEGEWRDVYLLIENPSSVVGAIDLTVVNRMKFNVGIVAGSDAEIIFDQIEFLKPTSTNTARYAISFDDANPDQHQMAAYLTSKGICGTFYIKTDFIDTAGHLTLQQLTDMHNAGHIIANHTADHLSPKVDGITLAQAQASIERADKWLNDNGFSDGVGFLALPFGSTNWETEGTNIQRDILPLVKQIRDTGSSSLSRITPADRPRWIVPSIGDDASGATDAINDAIAKKGTAISYFHSFSGTSLASFKTHVDAVAAARDAGNVDVVTIPELYTGNYLANMAAINPSTAPQGLYPGQTLYP